MLLLSFVFLLVTTGTTGQAALPADQRLASADVSIIGEDSSSLKLQSRQESCWELVVDGRRLHPQFIVRSVPAATLQDCFKECEDVLFNCETIAFGENRLRNTSCDLSDWDSNSLSLQPQSADTIVSATFSVYSRYGRDSERRCNRYSAGADSTNQPTPYYSLNSVADRPSAAQTLISEDVCYSAVYAGRRLSQRYVERSVAVISLDECKLLCTRETTFDCRSFNFRHRLSASNCDLSREDSASLDLSSSYVFFSDPDVDYYQRVGKGQTCYRYPPGSTGQSSVSYRPPLNNQYYETSSLASYYPSSSVGTIGGVSECYRRVKSGYRLDVRVVRESARVRGLYECELQCQRSHTFLCRSFSFRLSNSYISSSLNNCDMSDVEARDLDPVRHLVSDRDSDIYERNQLGRNCRDTPVTTWNNQHRPIRPISSGSQCFLRTKSGTRLDRRAIRYTLSVRSPAECEQECINAKFFTCRSFSYRFSSTQTLSDAYHKAYDNCDLSDVDLNSLDPLRDLIDDRLYDSWQRISYSRECDVGTYRVPDTAVTLALSNRDDVLLGRPWTNYRVPFLIPQLTGYAGQRCFTSYRRGYRMTQRLVRDSIHVRNLAECELECSRTSRPFLCHAFHFRYTNLNGGYDRNPYNCELTDMTARDFDPYRDMMDDRDYELFVRSQFSTECDRLDPLPSLNEPILSGSSALEVTVSGHRCRIGHRCRPHRELGYWFCEIDSLAGSGGGYNSVAGYGSYYGAVSSANENWDYCCQPASRCGYSEGFHYPWCHVGPESAGQWRPCSDRYAERPYAYLHRQLPPNATESSSNEPSKVSNDIIDFKKDVEPLESNSFQISRTGQDLQHQPTNGVRYLVKTDCNKTGGNLEAVDTDNNDEDVQIVELQQN